MSKKRILYIESNRDGTIGGSYHSLFYLVEGLDKNSYEPIVMFYQDNILIDKFKKISEEVIVFDHCTPEDGRIRSFDDFIRFIPRFFRDILWGHLELLKKIDEIKPDIVHLNNSYAYNHDWVLACKRRGVKIIQHDRGTRPPASYQSRFFVRFIDAIICVSDAYLKYVTDQNLKPKLSCRVYNGLDVDQFTNQATTENRRQVRQDLGVRDEDVLIGMVGNVDRWKGQIVLARAITRVLQQHQNIKTVLVGKTSLGAEGYEAEIRSFIAQNELTEKVILAGYRDDIPALLNAFDIFVHASIEPEPFGRVIIEAMAMKKPIVATELGGPAEIIEDGASGTLVAMNDEIALADAILDYIQDRSKAEKVGENAYRRFVENFSSQKTTEEVEAVYGKVLAS